MQIIARNDEHRLVYMKVGIVKEPVWRIQRRNGAAWGITVEQFRARWRAEKAAKGLGLDLAEDVKESSDE